MAVLERCEGGVWANGGPGNLKKNLGVLEKRGIRGSPPVCAFL